MEKLAAAKKEVLVEIVKLAQKRGMKGSKGGWKEFLNFHDKKFGASMSDPGKRTPDVLLAFLETFTGDEDAKFFEKILQSYLKREEVLQLKQKSPDDQTPEQRLVCMTLEHPKYIAEYSFPSHEEGWMVIKLSENSKQRRSNEIFAIDCEMILCEDGSDALVKVCVVDRNLQVKVDELVNPKKAVSDYRTEITGITAKDLKGVTCSLVDVQKSMKKLLSHGSILVGHSLSNDLQALKIDHARVIDTSFIFKILDQSIYKRPSLNDLCKAFLGNEVRKKGAPHNCLDDACAAMKLVLAKIEHQFDNDIPLVKEDELETRSAELLLHGIPVTVACEELRTIFPENFTFELKPSNKSRKIKYSATAIFGSPQEAHQAFEIIVGNYDKDSFGRPQKLVSLQLSTGRTARFYVCEMMQACPNGQISSKKRLPEDEEAPGELKKLKTNQKIEATMEKVNPDSCGDHVKEIERLKEVLKQKDQEISALHRIVASLARKQSL